MTTDRVRFAGVELRIPASWFDITADLPEGSPFTLARGEEGVGVLQFSVAKYQSGRRPNIGNRDLREMLEEFGATRDLGSPSNVSEVTSPTRLVCGDFASTEEFIRVWYASDGSNVALVTFVSHEPGDPLHPLELSEAEGIVRSLSFPGK